jgi:hypothetical protein
MILLYGSAEDPPLSLLIDALQARCAPYAFLELHAMDREGIELQGSRPMLQVAGGGLALEEVRAVYARPLALSSHWPSPAATAAAHASAEALLAWLDADAPFVVSRPRAMQCNASKPLQIQLIGAAGLSVPDTLVTSVPAEARAFWRHHQRVIYKSCSGVRSIVRELDENAATRLDRLHDLPVQFQAWVPGVDIRVHVVGRDCFAAEIQSSAIDYRYASDGSGTSMQPIELPDDVASRCVALAEQMELPLAGIDLRRRPDGEHVCFEVNPMPAYSFFEAHSGLRISHALAELLCKADS